MTLPAATRPSCVCVCGQVARRRSSWCSDRCRARDAALRSRFGISTLGYLALLEAQGGRCAGCPALPLPDLALCVDHCHETGVIRGLLCVPCNDALGRLRDDAARLRRLADYLDTPPAAAVLGERLARKTRARSDRSA